MEILMKNILRFCGARKTTILAKTYFQGSIPRIQHQKEIGTF